MGPPPEGFIPRMPASRPPPAAASTQEPSSATSNALREATRESGRESARDESGRKREAKMDLGRLTKTYNGLNGCEVRVQLGDGHGRAMRSAASGVGGRIDGSKIRPAEGGKLKTVLEFAKEASMQNMNTKEAWECVMVVNCPASVGPDSPTLSLSDIWERYLASDQVLDKLRQVLEKKLSAEGLFKMENVHEFNRALRSHLRTDSDAPRYAYRVVRPDENKFDKEGLHFSTGVTLYTPRSSAIDFFSGLNDHIRNGSKSSEKRQRKPFISATAELPIALFWSGLGLLPIARIDLQQPPDLQQPLELLDQWHVGGIHSDVLYSGTQHEAFARKSKEIIFSTPVRARARVHSETSFLPPFTNLVLPLRRSRRSASRGT